MLWLASGRGTQDHVKQFNTKLGEYGLSEFHQAKPLVDGKLLCEVCGVKPGKILRPLQEEAVKF